MHDFNIARDKYNLNKLKFIGAGKQGKVYLIDHNTCIKLYKKKKYFNRELKNLKKAQGKPIFPCIYEVGKNYIIREYIDGVSLSSYFNKGKKLNRNIVEQIVNILESLKQLGFKRIDYRLAHIIITKQGELKVIDPTNVNNNRRSYPKKLISGLTKYGQKEAFLEYLKDSRPDLYNRWNR